MATRSILKWVARRSRSLRNRTSVFLLPRRHFAAALERERQRSDRSQNGFSLLTLSFNRRELSNAQLEIASDVVEMRIRMSDLAGWRSDRSIGIILPETPASGAWTLAEDLRRLMGQRNLSPKFTVHTHPASEPPQDQNDGPGGVVRRIDSADVEATPQLPVESLQVLLAQKLPAWKRALDIVGASTGLVLSAPILLTAAAAIKLTSKGPVMFVQKRHGLGVREFSIYKFRTMIVNAEELKAQLRANSEQDGPAFKMKRDPRITRIGSFLRSTSIDELPQLLNVLKGDMSLVGPRPLPCDESSACQPWQKARLAVTPGLTCIWQVKGRSRVTFDEWMRMDLHYARTRSLWHDTKLLFQTVMVVLLRKGAY